MPKSIANGVADCRRSRHRDAGKRAALAAAQSWRVSMNTGNCRVVLAQCHLAYFDHAAVAVVTGLARRTAAGPGSMALS
jgi:hypothetical protein